MSFACTELISWLDRNGRPRRQRFQYIYAVDEKKGLKDYRMDPSLRGDLAARHAVRPADYGVPRYVDNGFSWIVLFRKPRWEDHRYEFLGEGRALGRPAVRVGFHPIAPYRKGINEWEGEAWFDRDTAQILRVEARRPDDYLSGAEPPAAIGDDPALGARVTADFAVERNGMRFPRLIRLDMLRAEEGEATGNEVPALHVEQEYRGYRFFEVVTAEEIRNIVFGDEAARHDGRPSTPAAARPPPP